ncbi:MAG: hypothetical protein JW982_08095 [Spirochaetes bacterium]|nr:hypothetical protein [Spirochaetota bacterium]
MKAFKITAFIALLFVIFSCELDTSAPIRIGLVTIPSEVVKLHIAIFSGEDTLTQTSVDVSELAKDNMIELYVSPGKNRQIVMIAECYDGEGTYYAGYIGETFSDISAGKEVSVSLNMGPLEYLYWDPYSGTQKNKYWVTYYDNQGYYTFQWNSMGIPHVKYVVEQYTIMTYVYDLFYEGYDLTASGYSLPNGTASFRFYPVFEIFNLNGRKTSF